MENDKVYELLMEKVAMRLEGARFDMDPASGKAPNRILSSGGNSWGAAQQFAKAGPATPKAVSGNRLPIISSDPVKISGPTKKIRSAAAPAASAAPAGKSYPVALTEQVAKPAKGPKIEEPRVLRRSAPGSGMAFDAHTGKPVSTAMVVKGKLRNVGRSAKLGRFAVGGALLGAAGLTAAALAGNRSGQEKQAEWSSLQPVKKTTGQVIDVVATPKPNATLPKVAGPLRQVKGMSLGKKLGIAGAALGAAGLVGAALTSGREKKAALDELINQGLSFDEAIEKIASKNRPEDPSYLRAGGRAALTGIGGGLVGGIAGSVIGAGVGALASTVAGPRAGHIVHGIGHAAGNLAGLAAGANHGWNKSMKNQAKEEQVEKALQKSAANTESDYVSLGALSPALMHQALALDHGRGRISNSNLQRIHHEGVSRKLTRGAVEGVAGAALGTFAGGAVGGLAGALRAKKLGVSNQALRQMSSKFANNGMAAGFLGGYIGGGFHGQYASMKNQAREAIAAQKKRQAAHGGDA